MGFSKILKSFSCHSDCQIDQELKKIRKTLINLSIDDLVELHEFHLYKQEQIEKKKKEIINIKKMSLTEI
jgi:hypothetical protein